jgi:uncharacterized protein
LSIYRFELFKSPSNANHYWRFKAPNNEIVAQSEGYATKAGAQHAVNVIKSQAANAGVVDLTQSSNAHSGW